MVKKSHSPVQIINKLREAEILLNQGANVGEASRKIGITEQTYYRWRKEYGGLKISRAKRLKELVTRPGISGDILFNICASGNSGTVQGLHMTGGKAIHY